MLNGERGGELGRLGEWRVVRGVVKGEGLWRMLSCGLGNGSGGTGGMPWDMGWLRLGE
jgi:hypothetical protein